MIMMKENVVVYTVNLDTDKVKESKTVLDLIELFKRAFEHEGMSREAELIDNGGFSFRETERNSYFTEYKISITTRRKIM